MGDHPAWREARQCETFTQAREQVFRELGGRKLCKLGSSLIVIIWHSMHQAGGTRRHREVTLPGIPSSKMWSTTREERDQRTDLKNKKKILEEVCVCFAVDITSREASGKPRIGEQVERRDAQTKLAPYVEYSTLRILLDMSKGLC